MLEVLPLKSLSQNGPLKNFENLHYIGSSYSLEFIWDVLFQWQNDDSLKSLVYSQQHQ